MERNLGSQSSGRQEGFHPGAEQSAKGDAGLRAFDEVYQRFVVGERGLPGEAGSESVIRAYQLVIDATDPRDRQLIVDFGLRAAAAGLQQALGPIAIPSIGFRDQHGDVPLNAVYFFLREALPARPQTPKPPS